MNPLSAIRQFIQPDPRLTTPLNPAQAVGKAISAAELEGLGRVAAPATALPPVNGQVSFGQVLTDLVRDVNTRQVEAGAQVAALQRGEGVPLHQAMIAMEEASVSFQLMVEVRNKLLESYQEIMRMQI